MDIVRDLVILQNNITSIRPTETKKLLLETLTRDNVDIAILSEIWLKENEAVNIKGYKFPKKTRIGGYGGVGFLVKNEILFQEIKTPKIEPIEIIAIETLNTKNKILFISVYIPPQPTNNQIKEPLTKLFDFIKQQNNKTILAGDFNAHNPLWNLQNNSCTRGELLVNFLDDSNLILMNDGSPTLIKPPNTIASAIDLTFVSDDLAPFVEWEILNEEISGNHKIIRFKITNAMNNFQNQRIFVNKKKAINNINNITLNNITNAYQLSEQFQDSINSAKFKVNSHRKTPKYWWNKEIEELYVIKQKNFIKYMKNLTMENFLEFKKSRAKLKSMIRKESRKSFNNLIEEINPTTTIKQSWDIVKRLSGSFPKKNNLHIMNNKDLANTFMNINFPIIKNNLQPLPINFSAKIDFKINYQDLNAIIANKKDTSAPGYDGISYYFLKNLNHDIIIKIVEIMNSVLFDFNIPENWRIIKIVPIHKAGKSDTDATNYRPISLIPVFLKTINIFIKNELIKFLDLNNIIPVNSFGFKKYTSSINCINMLMSKIRENNRNGNCAIVTFLDLSKAFDNVNINHLINILHNKNIPEGIIRWIYEYLKDRKAQIILNDGTEINKPTNKGLPQGCPLSPILFNIYTSDIHKNSNQLVVLYQFADDFAIIAMGPNSTIASNNMNIALQNIVNDFKKLDMVVNPGKSAFLCFSKNIPTSIDVKIGNDKIPHVESHKYLGLWIDQKLNFKRHITETVTKIKKKTNILKMICKKRGGAHPKTALQVEKALIMSQIDYGISVYAIASKTDMNRIQTARNQSLRVVFRYIRSTPINVILSETGEMPVMNRAEYLTLKEIVKNLYYRNSPILEIILPVINNSPYRNVSFLEKIAVEYKHIFAELCSINTKIAELNENLEIFPTIPEIKKSASTIVNRTIANNTIRNKYKNFYHLYTDGSKTDTNTGYGFYDPQLKISISKKLNPAFSIMNAELIGILEALQHSLNLNQKKIAIFTDSKNSCQILQNLLKTKENYIVNEIYNIINTNEVIQIVLQWIPSHIGLLGNERADTAAKLSEHRETIEPYGLTLGDTLNKAKNEIKEKWNINYKIISQDKGSKHYEIMKDISLKPWFQNLYFGTKDTIRLSRIRSFHTATKERLYSWNLIRSSKCDACDQDEDIIHVLYDCSKHNHIRTKYQVLHKRIDLKILLARKYQDEYEQITKYLEEVKTEV